MSDAINKELKLFYCYAEQDRNLLEELEQSMKSLERTYKLVPWSDQQIKGGDVRKEVIQKQLYIANLVLLLVSPAFIASDYCYDEVMRPALERHKGGDARVIPIILRPVHWEQTPFSHLQPLPKNGQPITLWTDRDMALYNVVGEIERVIQEFLAQNQVLVEWTARSQSFHKNHQHQEALAAADKALRINTYSAQAWICRSLALDNLGQYDKALLAVNTALQLDPENAQAWTCKSGVLTSFKKYEEALAAIEQAIVLDPDNSTAWSYKSLELLALNRTQDANTAVSQAIRLDPGNIEAWLARGTIMQALENYVAVLKSAEKVLQLDPTNATALQWKIIAQRELDAHKDV